MRQQCGADASGSPSSCEPGAPRSQALVLELPGLSRGQAQRAESLRSAGVEFAQLKLVATPPDAPRRVGAKIVNATSCGLRRSQKFASASAATSCSLCLHLSVASAHGPALIPGPTVIR